MEAARRLERLTHRPGLHGGALRRTGIIVLWTLLYRGPSRHGVCDPSIGQLAAWAGCARSTVQLALARIEAAGIMGHVRRGLVVTGRWCQWTSAYLFASPAQWALSDTEARSAEVSMIEKKAQEGRRAGEASTLPTVEQAFLAAKWGLTAVTEGSLGR
jgi:DNA-binding transcriptional regulator YhcF (GntR family)